MAGDLLAAGELEQRRLDVAKAGRAQSQRGWKAQPAGRATGEGTLPRMALSGALKLRSSRGIEASSPRV